MRPMLTASADEAVPSSAWTFNEIRRLLSVHHGLPGPGTTTQREKSRCRPDRSLQIIASILLRKTRTAQSEETGLHLRDAHLQLMPVGAIPQQLLASSHGASGSVRSDALSARQARPLCSQFHTYCCLEANDVQAH